MSRTLAYLDDPRRFLGSALLAALNQKPALAHTIVVAMQDAKVTKAAQVNFLTALKDVGISVKGDKKTEG